MLFLVFGFSGYCEEPFRIPLLRQRTVVVIVRSVRTPTLHGFSKRYFFLQFSRISRKGDFQLFKQFNSKYHAHLVQEQPFLSSSIL